MPMFDDTKQRLNDALTGPFEAAGFELAEVVLSQYKRSVTVRIFVYGANGVTIDDCAHLSRMAGDAIDGLELFTDGYNLEVSSPGLDRPLTTARDFKYRVGETVKVHFADKTRKAVKLDIVSVSDGCVEFKDTSGPVTIDLAEIEKAVIVF